MPVSLTLPPLTPGVEWSIGLRDARTGATLAAHDPDRQLPTASVGKLFLLAEVDRRLAAGELDPAERLAYREDEWVADSGLWWLLAARELAVVDLCVLIGAVSDNLATNVLLRHVGLDAVTRAAADLGCTRSALLDQVREERGPQHAPTLSVGTAGELSRVIGELARRPRVRGWLAGNTDLSMVASAFGLDPLAHPEPDRGLGLVNKTGTISTVRADVGVLTGPQRSIAYAVLARWPAEADPRDDVLATMNAVGRELRAAVTD